MKFISTKIRLAASSAAFGGALLLAAGGAQASSSTVTANMQVTANVQSACLLSTTNMAFGSLSPSIANPGTATITWSCTEGTAASITVGSGGYPGTSSRFAANTADTTKTIPYGLYTSSTYDTAIPVTDTGTSGLTGLTGSGTLNSNTVTIYGNIAAADASAAEPGEYTDSVTLTLTYS